MIVVDLDDFTTADPSLVDVFDLLLEVRARHPDFKVTLFSIVGECDPKLLADLRPRFPWLDFVPHGQWHRNPRECEAWSFQTADTYLRGLPAVYERGFKAPGWQISDGCYQALDDHGFWVADQAYNDYRRPLGLRVYKLDRPERIHGHIGHRGGYNANELSLIHQQLMDLPAGSEFGFVKDHVE